MKHILRTIIFLLILIGLVSCSTFNQPKNALTPSPVPTPVPQTLFVDPGKSLGPINSYVYGSNFGPWIAFPFDMLDYAGTTGVTILRFPAGSWGDENDVKPYHIDSFMAFCNQISATATFSVRLRDGTPEKAAEMVRYTNIEKGYDIQYWSIGNEPTLYTGSMGRNYDTAEFNEDWRAFAEAMKAVDPSILLMGPEVHQFTGDPAANPKDSEGLDWMTEFLKANGDLVDVVTIHRYPFPKSGSNAKIEDLRQNTQEWDSLIVYLRGLIHEITGRDIPIAITEVASHYSKAIGGEGTPDSFYNAIWWGDVLGRLIRGGVLMVNQWMLTSYGGYGGWGLVTRGAVLPTYYTYQMYQHLGDELLLSSSDDPFITITAAKRDDGTLTLLVINLKDEPVVKPIQIKGLSPIQEAETWLLDLAHNAENLGMQSIPVDGLHLPGQSITFLIISP